MKQGQGTPWPDEQSLNTRPHECSAIHTLWPDHEGSQRVMGAEANEDGEQESLGTEHEGQADSEEEVGNTAE